jgi:hypothetical protein
MIFVKLIGGLGNQMFQYATARRLSHHHNTDLFLDVTGFASYALRKYELDIFRIHAKIASPELLKHVSFSRKDSVRLGIRHLLLGETKAQYFKEPTIAFQETVVYLPDNIYLDGYWQSEKYFAEIADLLRKDLSFVTHPSAINKNLLEIISGCNSVSLHIRRGDYVSNRSTMEIHGVLGIDYYVRALDLMEEKVKDPQIFVFSDDIHWARENLKTDLPLHFIDHNGAEKNYEDLRLMSNCKNHIIANSSFSWWGAWLSSNPEKNVITPLNWFNQSNMDTRDLIPASWYRI